MSENANTIDVRWPNEATPELIDDVFRVIADIAADNEPTGFGKNPNRNDVRIWLGRMMARVKLGGASVATGHIDGRMQGFAILTAAQRARNEHLGELDRLMTHPQYRGLGLAHRLIDEIIGRAKERGLETAMLQLRGNNHGAIAFFESRGFTEVGRLPNITEVGNHRYDEVIMMIQFPTLDGVIRHGSDPDSALGTRRRESFTTIPEASTEED